MRPSTILKSLTGAPAREVAFGKARLAALTATNEAAFADERALMRHLRRGRSVWMIFSIYCLKADATLRVASAHGSCENASAL